MGAIEDQLAGKTPAERNDIKCREFAKLTGETFTRGQYELTIEQGPRLVTINGIPMLEVVVSLRRNNRVVEIDGHLRFYNPPIKIPDGTFTTVPDPLTGAPTQRPNYTEAPRQALREMIVSTLRQQVSALA